MRVPKRRPSKDEDLLNKLRKCIVTGQYLPTYHAKQRQGQRSIILQDILYVLENGEHEPSKDEYKHEYKEWNYSIRGKTVDGVLLRVIVSFEKDTLLIITVINLSK